MCAGTSQSESNLRQRLDLQIRPFKRTYSQENSLGIDGLPCVCSHGLPLAFQAGFQSVFASH